MKTEKETRESFETVVKIRSLISRLAYELKEEMIGETDLELLAEMEKTLKTIKRKEKKFLALTDKLLFLLP